MPMSAYLTNLITDEFVGSTMVLFVTSPTDETDGVEVAGGMYSEQTSTLVPTDADPSQMTNTEQVVFILPACTVVAYGFKSASGSLLHYETLASPVTYVEGAIATIDAESLNINLN